MPLITVRVEEELKKEMDKLKHINWSELIRQSIRQAIEKEKKRNPIKALMINQRLKRKAPSGWNSVEEIRKWREAQ